MATINFKSNRTDVGFRFTSFGSTVAMEHSGAYDVNSFSSPAGTQFLYKIKGCEWVLYRGILYDTIVDSGASLLTPEEMINLIIKHDSHS